MIDKQIYQIGLTMINGVGDILARHLLDVLGDEEAVFTERPQALIKVPGISSSIVHEIRRAEVLQRAEKEWDFIQRCGISLFFIKESNYPERLRECHDAPVLFYFKGNTNLNASRVISVVGTRRASAYGQELTADLLRNLSSLFPDILVVSGLAYGIDICAHRNALRCQMPTVGVLAHGLDRIYPSAHRSTAVEMLDRGGLLTDYPSGTNPDRSNFVRRNRLVAGLSDATIVVESAEKGGSLITADLAFSYARDVYAFPGRTIDKNSLGCNQLIRQNKAGLILSANDLVEALGWNVDEKKKEQSTQTQIIFLENEEEQRILLTMGRQGEMHVNELAVALDMPVQQLLSLLFELELDGKIKALPGNIYKRT